eukprot:UN00655
MLYYRYISSRPNTLLICLKFINITTIFFFFKFHFTTRIPPPSPSFFFHQYCKCSFEHLLFSFSSFCT